MNRFACGSKKDIVLLKVLMAACGGRKRIARSHRRLGIVSLKSIRQSGDRARNWLTREQACDLLLPVRFLRQSRISTARSTPPCSADSAAFVQRGFRSVRAARIPQRSCCAVRKPRGLMHRPDQHHGVDQDAHSVTAFQKRRGFHLGHRLPPVRKMMEFICHENQMFLKLTGRERSGAPR